MGKLQSIFKAAGRIFFVDGILLIPLAALVADLPWLIRGVSCGHDLGFHLTSWLETQHSWSHGVFYPHWAQAPNWDAGEPRFIFYPPVTWMLGAALGYLMPWEWVPAVLALLVLTASGFATRALARQFLPSPPASLAGALAAVTPYAFFTAYERSAFSELAAALWIPLLLLFAWRCPKPLFPVPYSLFPALVFPAFDGSTAPLALILAAVWLTNAPAGVMASYLLAYAAVAAAWFYRAWWPILRAAIAAVIGLGLAAFYLVPAAWEQRWIAIDQAVDVGMRIQDSWLFARHASPDLELHDQVLLVASAILVFTTVLTLGAFAVCLLCRKLTRESRAFWLPLALLIPILLLLQLPISAVVWNHLPKLRFLQFPWRWLMVLGTPYAIFLAAATPIASRRSRIVSTAVWTAVLAGFVVMASSAFFQFCDEEDQVVNQVAVFHAGTGVEGTDEYAALGSDNTLVASGLPDACLVTDPAQDLGESDSGSEPVWYPEQGSCDDTFSASPHQKGEPAEEERISAVTDHSGYLILRLRRYPAWRVAVNGQPVTSMPQREDGLVVVAVPQGPVNVTVDWSTTSDVVYGRRLSLGALALLIALWALERIWARRLRRAHLSSKECRST